MFELCKGGIGLGNLWECKALWNDDRWEKQSGLIYEGLLIEFKINGQRFYQKIKDLVN
jgi:hypothetical protein